MQAVVLAENALQIDLLADDQTGFAGIEHDYLAQHLAHDNFDVFVVDFYPLQAVNVLDFAHDVCCQFRHAAQAQDVMRSQLAIGQHVALFNLLAFEDVETTPFRDEDFDDFVILGADDEALFAFGFFAKGDGTGFFSENRRLFRFARFKEVGNARQTTGDVRGFPRRLRHTRQNVTHFYLGTIVQVNNRAARQEVVDRDIGTSLFYRLSVVVQQLNQRTLVLGGGGAQRVIHDGTYRQTGIGI